MPPPEPLDDKSGWPERKGRGPWALRLRPDRPLAVLLGAVGSLSALAAALALADRPAIAAFAVIALLLLTARAIWRLALRGGDSALAGIELTPGGAVFGLRPDAGVAGWRLAAGSACLGSWVLLRLVGPHGRGRRTVVLTPGGCSPEALRRLRVGLQWGLATGRTGRIVAPRGTSGRVGRSGRDGRDRLPTALARPPAGGGGA